MPETTRSGLLCTCLLLLAAVGAGPLAGQLPSRPGSPRPLPEEPPTSSPAPAPVAPAAPNTPAGSIPPATVVQAPALTLPAPPSQTSNPVAPGEERPPLRILRTGGIKVETAALIMSGQQGGHLPFAALGLPFQGPGERALVPVFVEIKGASFLDTEAESLRFDVSIYALGAKGDIQGTLVDTVEIDPSQVGPQLAKSGVKLVGELTLLPGDYTLRVLIKDPTSEERVGLRSFPLSVPDFKAGAPYLLPPMFADPEGAWLVARSATVAAHGRETRVGLVTSEGGDGEEYPSARPILAPEDEVPFSVGAFHLDPAAELRVELRKPTGEVVADLPARISSRRETAVPGLTILTGTFETGKIESAEYDISVVAIDPTPAIDPIAAHPSNGQSAAARTLRSAAVAGLLSPGAEGRVWAEFGNPAASDPNAALAAAMAEGPSRRRRKLDVGATQATYRRALQRLASGDEDGARTAVRELETPLLTGKYALKTEEMADVEMAVARGLSASQPEGLVPVMMLYEVLYRDELDRKLYLPATHAGEMIFRLSELYAQTTRAEGGKRLAADFLVGLAQGLVESGLTGLSERAFKRALSYDPGNEVALLSLAVHEERNARYERVLPYLQQLLASHPEHPEGRLRLALNLRRLDKGRQTDATLETLVGDPAAPDWVASVACQELARSLLAQDKDAQAAAILEAGLKRLPGDEKLLLERALVLDLARQAGEARGVLAAVKPAAAEGSPRKRYTEMPFESLEGAWNSLRASVKSRLPSLAAAVGTGTAVQP